MRRAGRASVFLCVALVGATLGFDVAAPPTDQWSARGLIGAIRVYQLTLSPLLGSSGIRCRFEPTCSHYGVGVLQRYGTLGGSWRAAWRVLRCAPWTPAGTVDPP